MVCQDAVRKCYGCLGMTCVEPWKDGGEARYLTDPSRLSPPCPASCRFRCTDGPSPAAATSHQMGQGDVPHPAGLPASPRGSFGLADGDGLRVQPDVTAVVCQCRSEKSQRSATTLDSATPHASGPLGCGPPPPNPGCAVQSAFNPRHQGATGQGSW